MNFIFFLLPLFCSASLLPDLKNVSNINGTSLISSLADANPDDVEEVRRLVDELIAAGETARETATTARDGAQDAKNAAGTALEEATDAHTRTAGELVGAEEEEGRLTTLEDEKRIAKEAAQAAKDAAAGELTAAEDHLASETTRLDGEKETLEHILVLLDNLLGVKYWAVGPIASTDLSDNVCGSDGVMAMPKTQVEQQRLFDELPNLTNGGAYSGIYVWLGGKFDENSNSWIWNDGSPIGSPGTGETNWDQGEGLLENGPTQPFFGLKRSSGLWHDFHGQGAEVDPGQIAICQA